MRYFKLLKNYFKGENSSQIKEEIYPEDYKLGDVTVETYVKNTNYFGKGKYWQEVSEKEYWQQELDNGKLVQGGYYVVKEFSNIFKLPEKWCITTTQESQGIIFDWFEKNTNWRRIGKNNTIGNHYCIDNNKITGWMYHAPKRKQGYTEITFEQFNEKRITLETLSK